MNDICFVTAQPDVPYFHWQCKLYIYNFIKLGIRPSQIHVIFSTFKDKNPSDGAIELKQSGVNVHFFTDERIDKSYIPSIKPYLISKWIEMNPELGNLFFLHDADIIFRKLPNFQQLIIGDVIYLSDTIGYIGYDYIKYACKNYERKYSNLSECQLLEEMTKVVDIPVEIIKLNQKNSGGGQYLIKNTSSQLWYKIYEDCTPLYNVMKNFHREYPIENGAIQFWTAEMWSTLWNLWRAGHKTEISTDLDFSWATDNIRNYEKKNILHMAGVTNDLKVKMFYKGDYINTDPIKKLQENPEYFEYIDKNNATTKYIEVMQNYVSELK